MKLAFSTNAFTRHPLEHAVQVISSAGYQGVEILADTPHVYPPSFTDAQADALAAQLNELSMLVSNVNANCTGGYFSDAPPEPFFEPSLISPLEEYRRDRLEMIGRTLQIARRIGARNISITTGRLLSTVPPARAATLLRENLAAVLTMAQDANIKVGIECEPGLYVEWATELRELIDEMGSELLGANLDVGHSFVAGESIPEVIELLAGRIWNIHVEDIQIAGPQHAPKHYHLIPGQGNMDFHALRDALKKVGYDGFLTVELYTYPNMPEQAARESLTFLRHIMQ